MILPVTNSRLLAPFAPLISDVGGARLRRRHAARRRRLSDGLRDGALRLRAGRRDDAQRRQLSSRERAAAALLPLLVRRRRGAGGGAREIVLDQERLAADAAVGP